MVAVTSTAVRLPSSLLSAFALGAAEIAEATKVLAKMRKRAPQVIMNVLSCFPLWRCDQGARRKVPATADLVLLSLRKSPASRRSGPPRNVRCLVNQGMNYEQQRLVRESESAGSNEMSWKMNISVVALVASHADKRIERLLVHVVAMRLSGIIWRHAVRAMKNFSFVWSALVLRSDSSVLTKPMERPAALLLKL